MTSSQCCGLHVKTCAMIVAVLGLIGSSGSLAFSAVSQNWAMLPISILMIATYIFVIVGVDKERSSFLMPAQIILGVSVFLCVILVLALIILGIILPDSLVEYWRTNDMTYEAAKSSTRFRLFAAAFIYTLEAAYTLFAFTVIHRARRYLSYI